MKYSTINKCRCCNKKNLKKFLNFGKMCLSTEFPPINTKRLTTTIGDKKIRNKIIIMNDWQNV